MIIIYPLKFVKNIYSSKCVQSRSGSKGLDQIWIKTRIRLTSLSTCGGSHQKGVGGSWDPRDHRRGKERIIVHGGTRFTGACVPNLDIFFLRWDSNKQQDSKFGSPALNSEFLNFALNTEFVAVVGNILAKLFLIKKCPYGGNKCFILSNIHIAINRKIWLDKQTKLLQQQNL